MIQPVVRKCSNTAFLNLADTPPAPLARQPGARSAHLRDCVPGFGARIPSGWGFPGMLLPVAATSQVVLPLTARGRLSVGRRGGPETSEQRWPAWSSGSAATPPPPDLPWPHHSPGGPPDPTEGWLRPGGSGPFGARAPSPSTSDSASPSSSKLESEGRSVAVV